MPPKSFRISRDHPAYYLTSVTKDRLPIFRTDAIAQIVCNAIDEARRTGKFLIFSYVIMPDHTHFVTDSQRESRDVNRYLNGIISRRVIDHLKANGHESSLEKLREDRPSDGSKYSLWSHHPDTRLLWSEQMLWQRIQYTHLNPVRLGLVDHPNDWRWSSARIFHRRPAVDEPLRVDIDKIVWRT
ncbi:MAG: transposase [Pyrinomonadaceae bacterium]